MKSIIYVVSIILLFICSCESESISKSDFISIYVERIVGKWRLGQTFEVREFTDDGLAFVYSIEEGRGEQFQYFDADESTIRFYKDEDLSGESWGFPYELDYDSTGAEHLIFTVIHPGGQGYLDCDYTRME